MKSWALFLCGTNIRQESESSESPKRSSSFSMGLERSASAPDELYIYALLGKYDRTMFVCTGPVLLFFLFYVEFLAPFLKWYFACNLDATLLLSCVPWPSLCSTPWSEGTRCVDKNAWEIVEARSNEGLQSRSLKEFPPLSCPINVSKSESLLLLCMLQQQRCTERFSSALRPSHRLGDWLVPRTFPLCQGLSLQLGKSRMWALGLGIQISAITQLASLGTSGWLFL